MKNLIKKMPNIFEITTYLIISILFIIVILLLSFSLSGCGCSTAQITSSKISKEADNFETARTFTVVNTRTDKIIFRITGTFSIQQSSGDVDIICKTGADSYQKHFVELNDWTTYIVEDLNGNGGDLYYTKVEYYPEITEND